MVIVVVMREEVEVKFVEYDCFVSIDGVFVYVSLLFDLIVYLGDIILGEVLCCEGCGDDFVVVFFL